MNIEKIIGKTIVISIKGVAYCGKTLIKSANYAINLHETRKNKKERKDLYKENIEE
jgi:hypothetical protein